MKHKSLDVIINQYDAACERMDDITRYMNTGERDYWPEFAREAYLDAEEAQAEAEAEIDLIIRDIASKVMKLNPGRWFIGEVAVRDICEFLGIPLRMVNINITSELLCNEVPYIDIITKEEYDQLINGDGEVPF